MLLEYLQHFIFELKYYFIIVLVLMFLVSFTVIITYIVLYLLKYLALFMSDEIRTDVTLRVDQYLIKLDEILESFTFKQ